MKNIGVLGGGQLVRMLALAGYPLGMKVLCYEAIADICASQVTTVVQGDYSDEKTLARFLKSVDCVTFETENIPITCAQFVAQHSQLMPGVKALKITQDRLYEKELLNQLNISTTKFAKVNSWQELTAALDTLGFPGILKTRRHGYDGKGQAVIRDLQGAKKSWDELQHQDLIYETFVNFDYEVSLISVSAPSGEVKFYPLITNQHKNGILHVSQVFPEVHSLQQKAEDYARQLIKEFNYIGVMTIEFFVLQDNLIANEIAPRVHNTGHWTIEGATTSQFENHLRAISDLPLGETNARGRVAMVNLIGTEPRIDEVLRIPGAHYHTYGKEPRQGRKLGHITLCETDAAQFDSYLQKILLLLA